MQPWVWFIDHPMKILQFLKLTWKLFSKKKKKISKWKMKFSTNENLVLTGDFNINLLEFENNKRFRIFQI